jgi:hypothetical protein
VWQCSTWLYGPPIHGKARHQKGCTAAVLPGSPEPGQTSYWVKPSTDCVWQCSTWLYRPPIHGITKHTTTIINHPQPRSCLCAASVLPAAVLPLPLLLPLLLPPAVPAPVAVGATVAVTNTNDSCCRQQALAAVRVRTPTYWDEPRPRQPHPCKPTPPPNALRNPSPPLATPKWLHPQNQSWHKKALTLQTPQHPSPPPNPSNPSTPQPLTTLQTPQNNRKSPPTPLDAPRLCPHWRTPPPQ